MDLHTVKDIRQRQIRTMLLTDNLRKQVQDTQNDFKIQTSNLQKAVADLETAVQEVRHLTNQTSTLLDQSIKHFNETIAEISSNSEKTVLARYKAALSLQDVNPGTISCPNPCFTTQYHTGHAPNEHRAFTTTRHY